MTAYNLTNITSANTLVEQIVAFNALSGSAFMVGGLYVLFFLYLIVFKKYDIRKVWVGGSFFLMVIMSLAAFVGVVPTYHIVLPMLFLAGGVISLFVD